MALTQHRGSTGWKTKVGAVMKMEGPAERGIHGAWDGEGWAGRWPVRLEEVKLWQSLRSLRVWG